MNMKTIHIEISYFFENYIFCSYREQTYKREVCVYKFWFQCMSPFYFIIRWPVKMLSNFNLSQKSFKNTHSRCFQLFNISFRDNHPLTAVDMN